MEFITKNAKETQEVAIKIIKDAIAKKRHGALVLALQGELGAGKTTFVQGLAETLKIKERVLSPTFVILKRFKIYDLSPSTTLMVKFKNLYHIDCYRIEKAEELSELGFREILKNSKNIVIIEWAEKIKSILPKEVVWIKFKYLGEKKRKITIYDL